MHHRPRLTPRARRAAAVLAAAGAAAVLASCSGGGPEPAASAGSPACAAALAKLPTTVLDKARTPLDVAGAAAWGEPAVMLRCGLPALAPTSTQCLSVDGVDWVVDDTGDPFRATSYGRDPAVEVTIPTSYGRENVSAALVDVGPVARALPATGRACIG